MDGRNHGAIEHTIETEVTLGIVLGSPPPVAAIPNNEYGTNYTTSTIGASLVGAYQGFPDAQMLMVNTQAASNIIPSGTPLPTP